MPDEKKKEEAPKTRPIRRLTPKEIEPRYQEHLRRVAGPAKTGGGK